MDITPLVARTVAASPFQAPTKAAEAEAAARKAAQAFEATFISEMLKESGVNEASASFGGGAGEAAFSSFLTEQYANKLSERGGFGLSEQIFQALKARGTPA